MNGWNLHAVGDFRLDELETPVPVGEQVLVRVGAAGVCGSDIPRVFQLGTRVYPVVLGHEFAGEVVAVGPDADATLIGRRAAVFPLIPCRQCLACLTGHYVQCRNNGYLGSRDNGGFAEFCLVPSAWHLLLAQNSTPLSSLAMVEPSSVAMHALRSARPEVSDKVVVMGAGPIGLVLARLATLQGYSVLLTDVVAEKIAFANACGIRTVPNEAAAIADALGGTDPDVVFEGTGFGTALELAVSVARPGGTVILLGNPHGDTTISRVSHSEALRRELMIRGVWNSTYLGRFDSDWTRVLDLIESGELVVEDLITDRVPLEGLGDAMRAVDERTLSVCKLMMEVK